MKGKVQNNSKELERSNHNTEVYSGSVTKLLFTLLHSPDTQIESSLHYVNKLPSGGENRTMLLTPISDTKLNVEL